MGKKILSGIIATVFTASTVATSVIPMTNYKPYNENLVANTTDVVETNNVSTLDFKQSLKFANEYKSPVVLRVGALQFHHPENEGGDYPTTFNVNKLYLFPSGVDIDVCRSSGAYYIPKHLYQLSSDRVNPEVITDFNNYIKEGWKLFVIEESGIQTNDVLWTGELPIVELDTGIDTFTKDEFGLDIQAPSISGTNNFVVNVNNMLSKEEILSHITATDNVDDSVDVVIDTTTYNPDNKKIGDYEMIVSATDKSENKTTAKIKIKVVDVDKPVVNGTSSYTRSYNDPISLEAIKSALSINDNYDSGLELQLIQDNYTSNSAKVGTHTVTFKTKDSSNNESDVFTVTINVEDKEKPIISGPGTIKVGSNTILSIEDFITKFTINDGYDGNITLISSMITGFEEYLKHPGLVRSHTITISVTDKNSNTATQNVTLVVEDKNSPEIFFDDYFIILEQGQSLTPEQIKDYASKVLGIKVEDIKEVSGEYDTNVAGTYNIEVKTINDATYRFSLKVDESTDKIGSRNLNWYEYMYKWFSILFNFDNEYYRTEKFFDFKTRCTKICELYTTGQYKYLII